MAIIREVTSKFTGEGRFTSALQTRQHNNRGGILGEIQLTSFSTQNLNKFLIDDLDELLCRIKRSMYLSTLCTSFNSLNKTTHNRKCNVSIQ